MFIPNKSHSEVAPQNGRESGDSANSAPISDLVEEYALRIKKLEEENSALSDQLSHYRKLHGQMSDSINESLTIQKASEIITQHLEYDKIASALLELCSRILKFSDGNIFLASGNSWNAILPNENPDFQILLNNLSEEGIIDWILDQNRTVVIPSEELLQSDQLQSRQGTLVLAPLSVNKKKLGILVLKTDIAQDDFSKQNLQLLKILSLQAAIAIQYTRLYKNLEETHHNLENSQANLMHAIKLATVGEIAGGIAHEINNPLQIILGKIQIAKMGKMTPDTFQLLEMQALRIATIVRGLLTLARRGDSNGDTAVDFRYLVENTIELIRNQIEKRNITIQVSLASRLPAIWGNSIFLQQILLNFILSAKKRMVGGGEIRITAAVNQDGVLEVEIADNGPSLASNIIASILDPFASVGSSREAEAHFGLLISVQMIREIGGDITIKTVEPQGNIVSILMPIKT